MPKKTLYDRSLVIVMDNDQLGMDQVSIQPLDPRGQCYKASLSVTYRFT
jgi:hypothetical protein